MNWIKENRRKNDKSKYKDQSANFQRFIWTYRCLENVKSQLDENRGQTMKMTQVHIREGSNIISCVQMGLQVLCAQVPQIGIPRPTSLYNPCTMERA